MKIKEIHYNEEFETQFLNLPKLIQKKACKKEQLFKENPFHPSLRLHKLRGKLEGLWSISIDRKYRLIFKTLENGVTLFISIGSHAIYEEK
ncbi:MAG: type II toxin-antitoxin system mRNA interferase toxin, RelE/StbE family [Nitrospirae bacterium]|nr:type II toxin-antitoxin system mRNA interferase toxin, RelE/StbE family [Nitrospirota bacterium]